MIVVKRGITTTALNSGELYSGIFLPPGLGGGGYRLGNPYISRDKPSNMETNLNPLALY